MRQERCAKLYHRPLIFPGQIPYVAKDRGVDQGVRESKEQIAKNSESVRKFSGTLSELRREPHTVMNIKVAK